MNIEELKHNFTNRNIEFEYFKTRFDLVESVKREISQVHSIGIGNSQTLKELNISSIATLMNKIVYDKTLCKNKEDIKRVKKLALTSECYITSSNAITVDGKIVNVDHSGNRIAAMTFGPERVLIIVTTNKITKNESEGIQRVLNKATPMNARRAGIQSPCSINAGCLDCTQEVRVCNHLSIIRGQSEPGRMKIMLLNDELGF